MRYAPATFVLLAFCSAVVGHSVLLCHGQRSPAENLARWRGGTAWAAALPLSFLSAAGRPAGLEEGASKPAADTKPPAEPEQPLRLPDEEPLLLLDDTPDAAKPAAGADNSRCQVCHLNMAMEELTVTHARRNIGCADCHGNCDAHIHDESWAAGGPGTPPGIMYPPENIDVACGKCHDSHDVPPRQVLQRWQQNCPEKTEMASIVCTDCHGKHRLNPTLRKAWWDKKTGQPIKPPTKARGVPASE